LPQSPKGVFKEVFVDQIVWGALNDKFNVTLLAADGRRLDFEAFGSVYFRPDGTMGRMDFMKIDENEYFSFRPIVDGTTNIGALDYRSGVNPDLTSSTNDLFACRPTHLER
jgi:hypothetical protein